MTEKEFLEITHKLYSTNTSIVLETISEIRKKGEARLIEPLVEVADTTTDNEVRQAIFDLFRDLSDTESVPPIVNAVRDRKCHASFAPFLSSLWQSRLNFSSYMSVFLEVIGQESYECAIEAFTIIEETLENSSSEQISEILAAAKELIVSIDEHKQPLLQELIKSIQSFM